ncbi:MAG: molybdopterin-dependent oxidoreductase, partial [Turicibacter sp.]
MNKIQSTCNYCSLACNLDFLVENNTIKKVVPTKDYPVNKGFSCIKGLNLEKQNEIFKPNPLPRIKQPDGSFKHVSWDEGFNYTAEKLQQIIKDHGPSAVAGLSTGQLAMEEMALVGHVMRDYLKANLDGNTRLCMATSVVAHKQSFGFDAPPYTLNDFELSDTIILIGANPVVAHPIIWGRIRANKMENKKVIVIDPRFSETAKNADYYYGLKAKSDLVLLYTLANVLIEKNYINQSYIDQYTENFEEFKAFVADFTLDQVEEKTNLSKDQVKELAQLIHDGKNVSLWWTMGINQGYEAVRSAQAIINIALMTGNIGRPGTGANSITGQSNAMGSRVYSNQAGLYGGGDYDNVARRQAVAQALNMDESYLPIAPTLPYNVIIEKINAGEIKALWVLCTNPRHSWINNETFKTAMENLELLIVQDIYEDTDTSSHATVFFPVVSGLKKMGTIINTERRLSPVRPVLKKEAHEMSDFDVIYKLGEALGMGPLLNGWETPQAVFELMKACSKNMPCDMTGVNFDDLTDSKGIQWPFKEGDVLADNERRLYENN